MKFKLNLCLYCTCSGVLKILFVKFRSFIEKLDIEYRNINLLKRNGAKICPKLLQTIAASPYYIKELFIFKNFFLKFSFRFSSIPNSFSHLCSINLSI